MKNRLESTMISASYRHFHQCPFKNFIQDLDLKLKNINVPITNCIEHKPKEVRSVIRCKNIYHHFVRENHVKMLSIIYVELLFETKFEERLGLT